MATFEERNGWGTKYSFVEVADMINIMDASELGWQHITFLATIMAESDGWDRIRPVVLKDDPQNPYHLTVDRGICQLNSHSWAFVEDPVAYSAPRAIAATINWIKDEVRKGTKGARPWRWSPILDWQWSAYGTDKFYANLGPAREAVNQVRSWDGKPPI